jgi:hypothetical protein
MLRLTLNPKKKTMLVLGENCFWQQTLKRWENLSYKEVLDEILAKKGNEDVHFPQHIPNTFPQHISNTFPQQRYFKHWNRKVIETNWLVERQVIVVTYKDNEKQSRGMMRYKWREIKSNNLVEKLWRAKTANN